MRITHQPGFVLHARPWRETSLLVEVLTLDHGRMGLVARGVQGPRKQALRAALQPLQAIVFDAVLSGELAQLRAAESSDVAPRLHGHAMLAGFYMNELVMRLAPRHDPLPELYEAFAILRARLDQAEDLAWSLRCFERDLLDALGFGFDWAFAADGQPIDPAARYQLDPLQGPLRQLSERSAGERRSLATGAALLALGEDRKPVAADLASLRVPMRAVLLHHLGGRGLKSWELLGELSRNPD